MASTVPRICRLEHQSAKLRQDFAFSQQQPVIIFLTLTVQGRLLWKGVRQRFS